MVTDTASDVQGELPTGTVTFLLTDVEGSTPLWESHPIEMAASMRRHEEVLSVAIATHGGVRPLEQGEGDNVVAAFARASNAASAAVAAQLALANEEWPDGVVIRVRMALHTGEGHLQEGRTYAGPDLNRCARLRGLAHGGQIVVSRVTHDLLAPRPPEGVSFRDLGLHRLKGIERSELVHQLCHPGLPDSFPPLASEGGHPHNLPAPASDLIGRSEDRAAVIALIDQARVVTITGSGGAGKTRLALDIAHDCLSRNPDGVWWVDLAALADPDLVIPATLSVLGARDEPGRDPIDALVDAVDGRQMVIVLDNAEHLLDACAELAELVVARAATVRLLFTSREPIGMDGEWPWRIPSLAVPPVDATAEEIALAPAVELFSRRATRVRPEFAVTSDNADDIAQICRRLDGLPLAIELAAARVRMMSPSRIATGLDDRFRLLTGGGRRAVARQQTLQSSVEWSHDLLDDQEQIAFRRLAPFAGGFTVAAAEAVLADGDLDAYGVLDLVTRLVDKSLLVADAEGVDGRYRLLETMRQFAHDRLVAAGEVADVRDRHLAWCVGLARSAEPYLTGADQQVWLERLEAEHDNLRAACDWAAATGDGAALWSLAGSLPFFWVLHGHFAEAMLTNERARAVGDDVEPRDQLAGRWGSAYAAFYTGDYERAAVEAIDVIERAEALNDERILGRALDLVGTAEMYFDTTSSRLHLHQAIELAAAAGDEWCHCDALQILGFGYLMQDDHRQARVHIAAAGVLAGQMGNHQLIGWDFAARAWTEARTGNLDVARAEAEAAIRATERSGDPNCAGVASWILADVAIRQGQAAELGPALREQLDRHKAAGAGTAVVALTAALALAEAAAGQPVVGLTVIDDLSVPGTAYEEVVLRQAQAILTLATGDADGAAGEVDTMRQAATAAGNPLLVAGADLIDAIIAASRGETKEAEHLAHEALQAGVSGPYPEPIVDAIHVLAEVAMATGDPDEAARLLGGAARVAEGSGARFTVLGAVLGAPDEGSPRRALGDEAFDRAWTEGAALSTEELVAYVTRSRGKRRRPSVGWDSLTPTEVAVAGLVAEGLTNREIGERLFISAGTVKTHLGHMFAKLGAANRAEVAAEAVRRVGTS